LAILGAVAALASVAAVLAPRIAQDPAYHLLADARSVWGIPNFFNSVSNVAFLLPAALGLRALIRGQVAGLSDRRERPAFLGFCLGVGLVSLGSAYYHLSPNNSSLVWDRLPMTLAFTSLLALVIMERISLRAGNSSFWPMILLGLFSVAYWHYTEQAGAGDLRLYGLVQFLPLLLIPLMIWLFPARYTRGADMLLAVGFYGVAKLLEHFDDALYLALNFLSGHTLKHLIAAAACFVIVRMVLLREPLNQPR
jgi:hypothetical protein